MKDYILVKDEYGDWCMPPGVAGADSFGGPCPEDERRSAEYNGVLQHSATDGEVRANERTSGRC